MTEPSLTPSQIEQKLLEENAKELEQAVSEYMENENCCCAKPQYLEISKEARDPKPQQDSLALIFEKQKQLSEYLAKSKPTNYYHHGQERYPYERVKLNCDAIIHEAIELVDGTSWKWWKDYQYNDMDLIAENEVVIEEDSKMMEKMLEAYGNGGPKKPFLTDEQRATQKQILENSKLEYIQKELIDIAHFLFQACIETGMTPEKFLEMYLDKNTENHSRQNTPEYSNTCH